MEEVSSAFFYMYKNLSYKFPLSFIIVLIHFFAEKCYNINDELSNK